MGCRGEKWIWLFQFPPAPPYIKKLKTSGFGIKMLNCFWFTWRIFWFWRLFDEPWITRAQARVHTKNFLCQRKLPMVVAEPNTKSKILQGKRNILSEKMDFGQLEAGDFKFLGPESKFERNWRIYDFQMCWKNQLNFLTQNLSFNWVRRCYCAVTRNTRGITCNTRW